MSGPAWDPSKGESRPTPGTVAKKEAKPRCQPCRPRGLAYLDGVLKQPNASRKLSAFVRFREHLSNRAGRKSRASILDRARLIELERAEPRTIVNRESHLEFDAATWTTILRLANATDSSGKTILEALVLLGLEQTSFAIREQGTAPSVAA